jgi:hypothetical protein
VQPRLHTKVMLSHNMLANHYAYVISKWIKIPWCFHHEVSYSPTDRTIELMFGLCICIPPSTGYCFGSLPASLVTGELHEDIRMFLYTALGSSPSCTQTPSSNWDSITLIAQWGGGSLISNVS